MSGMSLPPGFRFHPTDVELVKYYLKRKSLGKNILLDPIAEVNIYRYSPWDLPDKSKLKNKDLEWYFFCPVARKYASGARSNRATETGYWKSTGKDRPVTYNDETAGMIKTLIFHEGKPPKGERTDWVIHEYRIVDKELAGLGVDQAPYVLVKLFKKSGLGPKNGAQYGAPFKEEEYDIDDDDDEVATFPESLPPDNNSVVTNTFFYESTSSATSNNPPLSTVTLTHNNSYSVATISLPPSNNSPLSIVNHNNSDSVDTNTFFYGNTSATSNNPSLSSVTHNNSYPVATAFLPPSNNSTLSVFTHNRDSVAIPTQPERIPPAVVPYECNSVHMNSFQGRTSTIPLLPLESSHLPAMTYNYNSAMIDISQSGTPTGPLPVPAVSMHIPSAIYETIPVGEEVSLQELLFMFEPPVMDQVNGEDFLELDDINGGLGDLADWDELSSVFKI